MDSQTNDITLFHAVYVPKEDLHAVTDNGVAEYKLHVYTKKLDALTVIKKYKKGRLKSFASQREAENFAINGLEVVNNHNHNAMVPKIVISEDKSSNFKTPSPQELTAFRKLIGNGDLETVKAMLWSNPKYLIGSGDFPAILQEGCRYNALHISVRTTQPKMVELILSSVGDPKFVELIYGEESLKSYVDRANMLLDLYLNTPDKGLNETPLHFATKFGLKEIVKTLVSYPQCLKKTLNKHGQTPADVVCSRKNMEDLKLKNEILMLLEEQYFVPVLRAQDNTLQPRIGDPFSQLSPPEFPQSPLSPKIEVRALAGPMTKDQAVEFKKKWKTPPRIQGTPNQLGTPNKNATPLKLTPCKLNKSLDVTLNFDSPNAAASLSMRLQDTDKGLERVGRELASEYDVPWKEYWPFLNDFTDLGTTEGLEKLEAFLKKRICPENVSNFELNNAFFPLTKKKEKDDVDLLCKKIEMLMSNNSEDEDEGELEFVTPPSSPLSEVEEFSEVTDDTANIEIFLEGKRPTKLDFAVFNAIPSFIDVNRFPCTYRWRHEMQLVNENTKIRLTTNPIKRKLFQSDLFKEN